MARISGSAWSAFLDGEEGVNQEVGKFIGLRHGRHSRTIAHVKFTQSFGKGLYGLLIYYLLREDNILYLETRSCSKRFRRESKIYVKTTRRNPGNSCQNQDHHSSQGAE